ncbi:MAG: DUF4286 family protein [Muribaculaceae bacterium]
MLLYNTTFGVDKAIQDKFIQWLRLEFIPISTDSEYLSQPELFRVNSNATDPSMANFALHFRADSREDIENWYQDHGSSLFDQIMQIWNGQVVFFSTTLESL